MSDWCLTCQFEDYDGSEEPCINCVSDTEIDGNAKPTEYFPKRQPKPITNADRIRGMSDEELDEFLNEVQGDAYLVGFHAIAESRFTPYGKRWLDWLKEAKE